MALSYLNHSHNRCRGVSMVESLVAIAITAIAGSVLLMSIASSIGTSTDVVQ